jgi:hypothetical protein
VTGRPGFDSGNGLWKLCVFAVTCGGGVGDTHSTAICYRDSGVRFGTESKTSL